MDILKIANLVKNFSVSLDGKPHKLGEFVRVQTPSTSNNGRGAASAPTLVFDPEALERILGRPAAVSIRTYLAGCVSEACIAAFGRRTSEDGKLIFFNSALGRYMEKDGKMVEVRADDRVPPGGAMYYQPTSNNLIGWVNGAGRTTEATKAFVEVFGYYSKEQATAPQTAAIKPEALDTEAFAAWAMEQTSEPAVIDLLDSLESAKLTARIAIKRQIMSMIEGKTTVAAPSEPVVEKNETSTASEPAPVQTVDDIPF